MEMGMEVKKSKIKKLFVIIFGCQLCCAGVVAPYTTELNYSARAENTQITAGQKKSWILFFGFFLAHICEAHSSNKHQHTTELTFNFQKKRDNIVQHRWASRIFITQNWRVLWLLSKLFSLLSHSHHELQFHLFNSIHSLVVLVLRSLLAVHKTFYFSFYSCINCCFFCLCFTSFHFSLLSFFLITLETLRFFAKDFCAPQKLYW